MLIISLDVILGDSLGFFILNSFKCLHKARNHDSLEYVCLCNVETEVNQEDK